MPTAPTGIRRRSWMGAATDATPAQVSSTSAAQPRARVRSSTPSSSDMTVTVLGVKASRSASATSVWATGS